MFDTVFGWFKKPSEVTIPLREFRPVEVPVEVLPEPVVVEVVPEPTIVEVAPEPVVEKPAGNGMSELPPGVIHKVKNWKLSETGGWKRFVLLQEYGAAEPNWIWQESTFPVKDNLGG